jgi:hypothetical protein
LTPSAELPTNNMKYQSSRCEALLTSSVMIVVMVTT